MASRFVHEPLDDASSQIRLLTISNGGRIGTRIRCTLTSHSIVSAPDYIAVSYTWGDPNTLTTISVNGSTLRVRQNCWYVLEQARIHGVELPLWIDAICINQEDDDEKTVQVARMGDIYRNAVRVHACIGPHLDDSEFLCARILEHAEVLGGPNDYGIDSFWPVISAQRRASQLLDQLGVRVWFDNFNPHALEQLRLAYISLTSRPYFYRLWVYQELFLAQEVKMLCGDSDLSLRDLHTFCQNFTRYAWLISDEPDSGEQWLDWGESVRQASGMSLVSFLGLQKKRVSLDTIPIQFSHMDCSDDRDRLFALLHVVDWGSKSPIRADYSKSTWDILCELLESAYLRPELFSTRGCQSTSVKLIGRWMLWLRIGMEQSPIHEILRSRRSGLGSLPQRSKPRSNQLQSRVRCIPHVVASLSVCKASPTHLTICSDPLLAQQYPPKGLLPPLAPPCRLLVDTEQVLAYLPHSSRPGDLLVTFWVDVRDEWTNVGMVLRKDHDRPSHLQILGQAVLPIPINVDEKGGLLPADYSPYLAFRPVVPVEIHFDREDLLLLLCQHMNLDDQDGEASALERLETSVTDPEDPFSSFGTIVALDDDSEEE